MYPPMERALRWRGVPRQDVARDAHGGVKSLLASRLRPLSRKVTHPPNYRSLHTAAPPPRGRRVVSPSAAVKVRIRHSASAAADDTAARRQTPTASSPVVVGDGGCRCASALRRQAQHHRLLSQSGIILAYRGQSADTVQKKTPQWVDPYDKPMKMKAAQDDGPS